MDDRADHVPWGLLLPTVLCLTWGVQVGVYKYILAYLRPLLPPDIGLLLVSTGVVYAVAGIVSIAVLLVSLKAKYGIVLDTFAVGTGIGNAKTIAGCLAGGLVLAVLAMLFYSCFTERPALLKDVPPEHALIYLIVMVLNKAMLTPLWEELLVRGLFYSWLRRHLGFYAALSVSAVVFSLMHGLDQQPPYSLVLGFVLGYSYEKTRSLAAAYAVHASYNLGVLMASYFGVGAQ
jgi:membrane protease YdiL (CAAX protease family)